MKSQFNFNVDVDKLRGRFEARKLIRDFERAFEKGIKNGYKELSDRMIDKLIENITKYGLESGDIINSLDIKITDKGVSLIIRDGRDGYAMYVEYGTGVVGKGESHPKFTEQGWIYDKNEHGEKGWWYPSTADDPNPTKYRGEFGWWAWTKGQRSRPFMYDTWLWTSQSGTQIIAKNINNELTKLERKYK